MDREGNAVTDHDVLLAKTRALNVINGFIRVTDQQARDALRLSEALQEANRRLREAETVGARPLPDGFDQIFGDLRRGA